MTDQPATPLTEQQLDEITARANAATSGPWKRKAELASHIVYVDNEDGTFSVLWNAEWATEADAEFTAHAPDDVRALLADLRRARDRVAELEAYAYGCDAEGCVLPHSSWCDAAKKTAAANDGCTCGKPWTGHPQPHAMHCWTVNPPRAEVEEMRKRIAELSAEVSAKDAAPAPPVAPLAASQPSEAPTEPGTPTSPPTPLLDRAEHYLSVLHTHHAQHDTLAAGYGCAGCELRDAIRAQQAAATEDPAPAEQPAVETAIGSITIRSESVQLDNGECLRDLAVGDSVELRPDTGHEGLWIAAAFHGDYQDQITLQHAEVVEDCGNDPALACKFSGSRHAHPVDLDGKVRPRPTP